MKFFDTHAHYNDEVYKDDLDEVLEDCKQHGVEYILNASYNVKASCDSIQLAKKYDYIYASIGIHPEDIEKDDTQEILKIYEKENFKKVVAIGEIGLDYAYVSDNKEKQIKGFIEQIEIANYLKLPILIHSRDAALDTYNVIKEKRMADDKTLFHCFQPSDDLVRLVLDRGYTVAFGGNITFPRNESFKKYIEMIPIEQIVLETDSPYLSPMPFRGKRNTSANLPIICEKLAEYKGLDKEYVSEKTYENAVKFFGIEGV